ncbi:MAG: hypothetical protein NUV75_10440, partial [Gallionella sp.]|nr:hypothetical protein [Gallionella sp.]
MFNRLLRAISPSFDNPAKDGGSMSPDDHPVAAKRIEELQDIPRYPPFMQGLPVCSPEALIETQSDLI